MAQVLATDALLHALSRGPATLDALAARLGGADREELLWALGEAGEQGLAAGAGGLECGPDGLCGTSAPTVYRLTDAGRATVRASRTV